MTLTNTNHNLNDLKGAIEMIKKAINDTKFNQMYEEVLKTQHSHVNPHFYEKKYGKDLNSIVQLGIQGIKGAAAYLDHVYRLQEKMKLPSKDLDEASDKLHALQHYFVFEASMDQALAKLLSLGTVNFEITKMLDDLNTKFNGVPELTAIPIQLHPGPCILITGHDLVDLRTLLEKCEAKNINVYTHGEMLPSFMYPELKKFKCLKANYGHAW